MKQCKWCGEKYLKLAKSHIIPRAFFNYDGHLDKFLISGVEHKKRRPIGSYDSNILCNNCESEFSHIDDKAANILLKNFDNLVIPFGDKRDGLAYQLNGSYEYDIKIFLIYTLWKASVSYLDEFAAVKLGPYEDIIKEIIINSKPIPRHDFSFIGVKIANPSGLLFPLKRYPSQYDGRRYYMLSIANYIFDIKVDNLPPIGIYKDVAEHRHSVFIKQDKTSEKIKKIMINLIKQDEINFPNSN